MDIAELYRTYKSLCFSISYQLTGSISDAEDVVQDVFLKLSTVTITDLEEPKAYLCKMTVNRCYDVLKSGKVKREQYVGPWLPEPLPTGKNQLEELVERSELLNYGMLVLLERLTIVERTVFVLREALGFEYAEIAKIVGKNEVNCRKILSRTKEKIELSDRGELQSNPPTVEWIHQFLGALELGQMDQVITLLSEDVTLLSDGGGKVSAALKPIVSRDFVLRFIMGIFQNASKKEEEIRFELTELNGETGVIVWSKDEIMTVALVHIESGMAKNFYFIRNPEKLNHLSR
ncbi:RNA polymerase sigma factor SigJ [Chungangia koreensis]|uniref:RNA polymerase sigma factor SigJ n=1 Tax=Chungangia koreensis TaxID=752657 RepID=A0ABV8X398_9LACT